MTMSELLAISRLQYHFCGKRSINEQNCLFIIDLEAPEKINEPELRHSPQRLGDQSFANGSTEFKDMVNRGAQRVFGHRRRATDIAAVESHLSAAAVVRDG